jgi:hypothetical protein
MIGVGGIRPSRGLSGNTDGFRTHGDRDFGSCGVLGRELVEQRHDLPDVAHRVVARSRRDALLIRKVFQDRTDQVKSPPRRATRDCDGSSSTLIDAYVVLSRCGIRGGNILYSWVSRCNCFARRSEGSKYFERRILSNSLRFQNEIMTRACRNRSPAPTAKSPLERCSRIYELLNICMKCRPS